VEKTMMDIQKKEIKKGEPLLCTKVGGNGDNFELVCQPMEKQVETSPQQQEPQQKEKQSNTTEWIAFQIESVEE
jgi:hypothetical protein